MKKILFYGDSITDMGRYINRDDAFGLGIGYVFISTAKINEKYPGKYKIINRGVSGNTVLDLLNRYEEDVLNNKPDVISILIGVNDVWHRIGRNEPHASKPAKFMKLFEELINKIKTDLPNTKIIVMEPFFTKGSATTIEDYYEKFEEVYKYARKLKAYARKNNIVFVKLQKKMVEGQEKYGSDCLFDGVHPNAVGASIISNEFMKTFNKMEEDL